MSKVKGDDMVGCQRGIHNVKMMIDSKNRSNRTRSFEVGFKPLPGSILPANSLVKPIREEVDILNSVHSKLTMKGTKVRINEEEFNKGLQP